MNTIKVKCPAKINLDLKIIGKRSDGFHNIKSIMQTINLYDYLTIKIEKSSSNNINLSGTSDEIPYNNKNIIYKAIELYLNYTNLVGYNIDVYIEKNIPVSAGLAGGSTDGAGVIVGLNKIFEERLNIKFLHEICAKLGSDLNFCLEGGRMLTEGRGEILTALPYEKFNVNLIKPINLGISAKEAYTSFAEKFQKETNQNAFKNDLEWAIIENYPQLQFIKNNYKTSMMTGSGSTYFSLEEEFEAKEGYWIKNGLETTEKGVEIV